MSIERQRPPPSSSSSLRFHAKTKNCCFQKGREERMKWIMFTVTLMVLSLVNNTTRVRIQERKTKKSWRRRRRRTISNALAITFIFRTFHSWHINPTIFVIYIIVQVLLHLQRIFLWKFFVSSSSYSWI